jgi:hypothetical protein
MNPPLGPLRPEDIFGPDSPLRASQIQVETRPLEDIFPEIKAERRRKPNARKDTNPEYSDEKLMEITGLTKQVVKERLKEWMQRIEVAYFKNRRELGGYLNGAEKRLNNRHTGTVFWERAARLCLALGAVPEAFVAAQFQGRANVAFVLPNCLGGEAAERNYKRGNRPDLPAYTSSAQIAVEQEHALAASKEDVSDSFQSARRLLFRMTMPFFNAPPYVRWFLAEGKSPVREVYGLEAQDYVRGRPELERQLKLLGFDVTGLLNDDLRPPAQPMLEDPNFVDVVPDGDLQ